MNLNSGPMYDLRDVPFLGDAVLVVSLAGWVDAAQSSAEATKQLLRDPDKRLMARFNTDRLLDQRARRPILKLVDGVTQSLTWPALEMHLLSTEADRPVLLLHGPEPDHEWKSFAQSVVELAQQFNVSLVVGLGAFPAAVPHTRPTRLSCTASTPALAERLSFVTSTLEVPAGAQAVIEVAAAAAGIPAVGIWAQVPHYLAAMSFPPASEALLEGLSDLTEVGFSLGSLPEKSLAARSRLDELITQNPEHVTMLETLEQAYDDLHDDRGQLPSGDELAAELERFLRDQ
ncbi:MAG: PAC2 family protein [Actinobacteria bacterium]|jgi:hypothetical protein|nr:PAC2 family protein [Actinomycetota bacterium]MBT3746968.1 PAC2 family protein [Actinomycetota bacterium]MBT3970520.1 PAC2 family protein [Actinomycetota bacterium]MBT4010380.1 PAC2 family protein [Actinomycetota bacterium]MBT4302777.1 PAC2 family protein [Actinomycetota bacterium]